MRQGASVGGLLVRQATGLLGLDLGGIWNVGIWNVEWVRMFCSCSGWRFLGGGLLVGSSGRWDGLDD